MDPGKLAWCATSIVWCASLAAILAAARLGAPTRAWLFLALVWWIPALLDLTDPILASPGSFPADTPATWTADVSMIHPHLLALGVTLLERARR